MDVNQMIFQNGHYKTVDFLQEGMINGLNVRGNAESQSGSIQNAGVSNVSAFSHSLARHLILWLK